MPQKELTRGRKVIAYLRSFLASTIIFGLIGFIFSPAHGAGGLGGLAVLAHLGYAAAFGMILSPFICHWLLKAKKERNENVAFAFFLIVCVGFIIILKLIG